MPTQFNKHGYVYLIGSSVFGWYKIGKSKTPEVRVDALGILLPFSVELFGMWESEDRSAFESAMHARYGIHHRHGEWFSFTPIQVLDIVTSSPLLDGRLCFEFIAPRSIRCSLRKGEDEQFAIRLEENRGPVIRSHMRSKRLPDYMLGY